MRVTTDDNLAEFIRTEVVGHELAISRTQPMSPRIRPGVEVTVPSLEVSSISGSGDAEISGIEGALFEARISGSGNITAAGRTERLDVAITASGDVDARELFADAVRVEISGSGDADVHASELIDIVTCGSGDATYRGNPSDVFENVTGSGDVHPRWESREATIDAAR